jgi:hypothetical protein
MGRKLGIIVICGLPSAAHATLLQELAPEAVSLGICPDANAVDLLDESQAAIGEYEGHTLIFSRWFASEMIGPMKMSRSKYVLDWLTKHSRNTDILVAYMHSITETCGHVVYHQGQRVSLHYHDDDHDDVQEKAEQFPKWYVGGETEYSPNYVPDLVTQCMGKNLQDILETQPPFELYKVL